MRHANKVIIKMKNRVTHKCCCVTFSQKIILDEPFRAKL